MNVLERLGAEVAGHPRSTAVRADDEAGGELDVFAVRGSADDAGDAAVVRSQYAGRRHAGAELCACLRGGVGEQAVQYVAAWRDQHIHAGALLDPPYLRLALSRNSTWVIAGAPLASTRSSSPHRASWTTPPRATVCRHRVARAAALCRPSRRRDPARPATSRWPRRHTVRLRQLRRTSSAPSLDGKTLRRGRRQVLGEDVEGRWRADLHDFSTFPSVGSQAVAPDALDG